MFPLLMKEKGRLSDVLEAAMEGNKVALRCGGGGTTRGGLGERGSDGGGGIKKGVEVSFRSSLDAGKKPDAGGGCDAV